MRLTFIMKKVIGLLFMPLSLLSILFVTGIILLCFTRKQSAARIILVITCLLFLSFSYGIVFHAPLLKLERAYPEFDAKQHGSAFKWVVVLAGNNQETISRLVEGIRIQRSMPGSKLLVSGGRVFGPDSSSNKLASMAVNLGIKPSDIVQENMSSDTKDEARIIKGMVHTDNLILVTSAYHMPRSMALFRAQGMNPVPAPTDFLLPNQYHLNPWMFFPTSDKIYADEVFIHEFLGIIIAKMMGQIH